MSQEKKNEMEFRTLGGTGLKVSVFGFGTMTFNSLEQAIELTSAARDGGINFFDNAELYGEPRGYGEILFGQALKKLQEKEPDKYRRSDLVITTKLYFGTCDGKQPNVPAAKYGVNELGLSRKHLIEGINDSLKRLQLDYVDVIYAHRFDPLTPMEEIVRGFTEIIKSNKAFYWGTSMWSSQKITEAYWVAKYYNLIPPVVEQPIYNMFTRDYLEKEYVPLFSSPYNIGTTIFSPLDNGILTGKYNNGVPEGSRFSPDDRLSKWARKEHAPKEKIPKVLQLETISKIYNCTTTHLALAWVIKNHNVSVCILGAKNKQQLNDNFLSLDLARKLTKEDLNKIEEILQNQPPKEYDFGRGVKFSM